MQSITLDLAGQTIDQVKSFSSIEWSFLFAEEEAMPGPAQSHVDDRFEVVRSQNRDLLAELAELREENELLKRIPGVEPPQAVTSLIDSVLVPANVVGLQSGQTSPRTLLISQGIRAGLSGDELVLQGHGLLIDQGTPSGIESDQLVTLGRALLGRTTRIGQWTSLVQPMTDTDFRVAIRLVRVSDLGSVLGASGVLHGGNPLCQITDVAGTEPVAVGDLVFTDTAAMLTATPIYCGIVSRASIAPNAPHWDIEVRPHCTFDSLPANVTVLKSALAREHKNRLEE